MKNITISDTVVVGGKAKFTLNNLTLSPDHPNIIYIPVSNSDMMDTHILKDAAKAFEKYDKYKIVLIAVEVRDGN